MNTLFAPTPNNDPHVGHCWVAWLNWQAARRSGGEFVVLWDDVTYEQGLGMLSGWSLETGVRRTREQLTWMGMAPDREGYYSDHLTEAQAAAERLGYHWPRTIGVLPVMGSQPPAMQDDERQYVGAYKPAEVALWIVAEHNERIGGYWTGQDFLPLAALHDDMTARLGLRPSRISYTPPVRREQMPEKESKSKGAVSLGDLRRAGFEPWQIISTLRECARVSKLAGLADVVIPAGMLEEFMGAKAWCEYRGDIDGVESCLGSYGKHSGGRELRAYARELAANNLEMQQRVMDDT